MEGDVSPAQHRTPPQMSLGDWDSSGPRDQLIWDNATPRALVDKKQEMEMEMRFTYVVESPCESVYVGIVRIASTVSNVWMIDGCVRVCVCVALLPVDGRPRSMVMNHARMHQQRAGRKVLAGFAE